jgi:hypothetical protein
MHLTPADQLAILRGHAWSTGLDDYAFLQSIRFCTDCSGNMQQGDGQVVKIEVKFSFSVPSAGRLCLEFFDTPAWYNPQELAFARTEENACRQAAFDLVRGPHDVDCQTMPAEPFAKRSQNVRTLNLEA